MVNTQQQLPEYTKRLDGATKKVGMAHNEQSTTVKRVKSLKHTIKDVLNFKLICISC